MTVRKECTYDIHIYGNINKFNLIFFRNFRQTCQQLSGLDLQAWESDDEPEFITEKLRIEEETTAPILEGFNESILRAAIEKAKADVNERKQFEYEAWLKRMFNLMVYNMGKTAY